MADITVEELTARESQLTWSFAGFAAAWIAGYAWPIFMAGLYETNKLGVASVWLSIMLGQLMLRGWYAYAAARAARTLGETGWPYATWIMLAPLLSVLPIPIPLVPTAFAASPLSIKFLLGNQLQIAIREQGAAAWHDVSSAAPRLPVGRLEPGP